jgi:hypothetical protein
VLHQASFLSCNAITTSIAVCIDYIRLSGNERAQLHAVSICGLLTGNNGRRDSNTEADWGCKQDIGCGV